MAIDSSSKSIQAIGRNYIPSSPRLKDDLITVDYSDDPRSVKLPKGARISNLRNTNKETKSKIENQNSIHYFLHPWNNSVSGTGYGREYWSYQHNPYQY